MERSPEMGWNVESIVAYLTKRGSKRNREGMARFAIRSEKILGVGVTDLRALARRIGRNHALALALWRTKIHEARVLCAFIDEPGCVTPSQMDRWARDFDNWAVCDALCFHLFDRTPHAWMKIEEWSGDSREFVKRAAFALLASVAVHDKGAPDALFLERLPLIECAASDKRNFVKKAVNWSLRAIGKRNRALNAAAVQLARRLVEAEELSARWIGKDALRELTSAAVLKRLSRAVEQRRT